MAEQIDDFTQGAASHYHRYTHSLEPSFPLMGSSLYANQEAKNKMESRQTFPTNPVLFRDRNRQLSWLFPPPLFDTHILKLAFCSEFTA